MLELGTTRDSFRDDRQVAVMFVLPSDAAAEPRVLLADDDPVLREIVHLLLVEKGFSMLEASDGIDAWDRVQNDELDAVICDVNMPGMSGVELCRKIYGERLLHVPTIIITAGPLDLIAAELSEFPVFPMRKPFETAELSALLDALLAGAGAYIEADGLLLTSPTSLRADALRSGREAVSVT